MAVKTRNVARIKSDMAVATAEEALDCVETRIRWYKSRRIQPPPITVIACRVLREMLGRIP